MDFTAIARKLTHQYLNGLITEEEYRNELILEALTRFAPQK